MKKPITTYILMVLFVIQIIGAVPVGWSMITESSGTKLGIPLGLLETSPFPDFRFPGLILFLVLVLFPIFILYGLIAKKKAKWAQKINLYKNYHWAWTFSYYLGLLLVLSINM